MKKQLSPLVMIPPDSFTRTGHLTGLDREWVEIHHLAFGRSKGAEFKGSLGFLERLGIKNRYQGLEDRPYKSGPGETKSYKLLKKQKKTKGK